MKLTKGFSVAGGGRSVNIMYSLKRLRLFSSILRSLADAVVWGLILSVSIVEMPAVDILKVLLLIFSLR